MASKGRKTHRRTKSYGVIRFTSPEHESPAWPANNNNWSEADGNGCREDNPLSSDTVGDSHIRQGRKSRRDDVMSARASRADGSRGRTPSPKRTPAPKPPSPRDCPSPLPKMVSTADMTPADYQGWLIDQLRGRKVWCAISDMMFCVFEKEDSRVSKQVILLPGCRVRAIEFKSASQDGKVLSEVARRFASKTISGVDKYQFLIENSSNRQKFMFGVTSKQDLDAWMGVLQRACCIDVGSASADTDNETTFEEIEVNATASKLDVQTPRSAGHEDEDSSLSSFNSYSPAQTLPSRLDVLSLTLPMTQTHDVSKDSVDHIRRRIRKDCPDLDSKPSPMRVTHNAHSDRKSAEGRGGAGTGSDDNRKSWYSKIRSPLELLRRKKRSSSADDAHRRRKMFPIMEPDTVSNPSLSPRLSDSQPSLTSSVESGQSNRSPDTGSFTSSADSKDGKTKKERQKKRGFLSRSWDTEKHSRGILSSSIRRTASDFKDKMFGSGHNDFKHSAKDALSKSRSAGVKLKDLDSPRVSGSLQYKLGFKWTKVWCVVCRGCFYAFKTSKGSESPILAVVLNQCSVTYVTDGGEEMLPKRMFVFKMTQAHCKSVYICAGTHQALVQWMEILQTEAVKVQADQSLVAEITESRSSQKKREAKEMQEREEHQRESTQSKMADMQPKRYSCPDFRALEGYNNQRRPARGDDLLFHKKHYSNAHTGDRHNSTERREDVESNSTQMHSKETDFGKSGQSNDTKAKNGVLVLHQPEPDSYSSPSLPAGESSNAGGELDLNSNGVCPFSNSHNWKFLRPSKRQRSGGGAFNSIGGFDVTNTTPSPAFIMGDFDATETMPSTTASSNNPLSYSSGQANGNDSQTDTTWKADKNTTFDCSISHSLSFSEFSFDKSESRREETDTLKYAVESPVHDEALKEAWSSNEQYLLGVVRDKIRRRRQRVPDEEEIGSRERDIEQDILIVHDDGPLKSEMTSHSNTENDEVTKAMQPTTAFQSGDLQAEETSEDNSIALTSGSDDIQMEGFLEKKEVDDQWNRYWCTVQGGFLYTYLTPNDPTVAGATDLTGYTISQLVDKIQRKRFVLHLYQESYVDVFLSLDSRDELEVWHSVLQMTLTSLAKERDTHRGRGALNGSTESSSQGGKHEARTSSTHAVKQKLLAEMLRQKTELEKMQAARNGTKLHAIRRQLDESSAGGREKKTVFQIGRKRPDLIQSLEYDPTRQSDLEEQVKTLSSKLQEIDSHLSSHAVNSPRDISESTSSKKNNYLRHSYDSSVMKHSSSLESSASDFNEMHAMRVSLDAQVGNTMKIKEKNKDKNKEVNRSNSLKSSVQRFAHRTFARANWTKARKVITSNQKNGNNNNTSHVGNDEKYVVAIDVDRMEKPPDVIDITAIHNTKKSTDTSLNTFILPPPDSFRTEKTNATTALTKKHRTPKERILAKIKSSNSFNTWDRLNSRLKSSASSPCLTIINGNDPTADRRCATPQPHPTDLVPHIPKLELGNDSDYLDGGSSTARSDIGSFYSSHGDSGSSRSGFSSDRSPVAAVGIKKSSSSVTRPSGVFFSARSEHAASSRKSNRNSWACGISPRKEVNPNVLAEIEAFEMLSSKYLGS